MEQDINVRSINLEDVDKVVEIYSRVFDSTYVSFGELASGLADGPGSPTENAFALFREELVELVTSSDVGHFLAIVDGKIAGFALASLESTPAGHVECWLNDMGVFPNYQGKKIGRKLVNKVIE